MPENNSTSSIVRNIGIEADPDANGAFVRTGGLIPSESWVDGDAASKSHLQAEVLANQPGNQFTAMLGINVQATDSEATYEKAALIAYARTSDPSDLPIYRDAVAIQTFGFIDGNNPLGRVWAGHDIAIVEPGGDGYAVGREISVENNGSAQPLMNTPTTKIATTLIAAKNLVTAGLYISGQAGGSFEAAIYTGEGGVNTHVLRYDDGFSITKHGSTCAIAFGHITPRATPAVAYHVKKSGGEAYSIYEIPSGSTGNGQAFIDFLVSAQFARSIGINRATGQFIISSGEGLDATAAPAIAAFNVDNIDLFSNGGGTTGGTNLVYIADGSVPSAVIGGGCFAVVNGALYWRGSAGTLTMIAPA